VREDLFQGTTGTTIVCAPTSRACPILPGVVLPDGLAIESEVLVSHLWSIDLLAQPMLPVDNLL
jgi:hypothetical protein